MVGRSEAVVAPESLDLRLGRLRSLPAPAIEAMKRSLDRKGQMSPVVAAAEGERLELVDGFKRQAAAVSLGWSSLAVEVVALTAVERKAHVYLRNREQGLTLIEEGLLVRELHRSDGLSQVEIGDLLERHKSWVCRRLQFIEALSPHLLDDVRVGMLSPGSARRLASLPSGNQEEVAAAVERERLTPQQTARLVELWRRAPDETARRFVLTHPKQALAVANGEEPTPQDPRLNPRAQEVLRSLRILRTAAERLGSRCEQGIRPLEPDGRAVLQGAYRQAVEAAQRGWKVFESVLETDRSIT